MSSFLTEQPRRRHRVPRWLVVLGSLVFALAVPIVAGAAPNQSSWPSGGHDISNTHSNPAETKLNPDNVGSLAVKWTYTTHGDVSAVPAVVDGAVYFPDWGGYLNKVDAATGAQIWSKPISDYTGIPGSVSRASPAVVGDTIYLGDQNGGHLMAVNATTGAPIWTTRVDTHPVAILTAGPVYYNGVVYQGVASLEEGAATDPNYPCCTFRGSVVAVNPTNGSVIWKTFTIPPSSGPCTSQNPASGCGYSGGAIWGTTPAIDPASNTLYVTTGNNYTVPDSVKECEANGGRPGDCLSPDDHIDAVMALDASTGQIKWSTGVQGFDDWNVACIPGFDPHNCPSDPGPDFDFGSGPNLFTIKNDKGKRQLVVGAGQKSGQYWALDAATGQILWSQAAGPGSTLGGIEWGPATDGKRIYVAEENFYGIPYTLPSGETTDHGSWAAIDPDTGRVLWQTPDPNNNTTVGPFGPQNYGQALGPVSVANGVVYAPSMSGHMYALDAANGKILWDYLAQGSVNTGAVPVNGTVYWGDGYNHLFIPGWRGSTTFYAFSINGK